LRAGCEIRDSRSMCAAKAKYKQLWPKSGSVMPAIYQPKRQRDIKCWVTMWWFWYHIHIYVGVAEKWQHNFIGLVNFNGFIRGVLPTFGRHFSAAAALKINAKREFVSQLLSLSVFFLSSSLFLLPGKLCFCYYNTFMPSFTLLLLLLLLPLLLVLT